MDDWNSILFRIAFLVGVKAVEVVAVVRAIVVLVVVLELGTVVPLPLDFDICSLPPKKISGNPLLSPLVSSESPELEIGPKTRRPGSAATSLSVSMAASFSSSSSIITGMCKTCELPLDRSCSPSIKILISWVSTLAFASEDRGNSSDGLLVSSFSISLNDWNASSGCFVVCLNLDGFFNFGPGVDPDNGWNKLSSCTFCGGFPNTNGSDFSAPIKVGETLICG